MDRTATPPPLPPPLHRQRDFVALWAGQSVSALGTQVTAVALPLTAILVLHAGAGGVGLLDTVLWLPFLLFALPAGVHADRWPGRTLLWLADAGRAAVLAAIVVLGRFGLLGMPVLVGLVFLLGTLTVVFEVTYLPYVRSLVSPSQLVGANSRLQATASLGRVGGPAVGGLLVQALAAPNALLADALSFAVSVLGLLAIRARQAVPRPSGPEPGVTARIREGLRVTYGNPFLRALVAVAASYNLFEQWILTLFVLYAVRDLGMTPGEVGVVLSGTAVGAVLGSVLTSAAVRRLGLGRALLYSVAAETVVMLVVPAVRSPGPVALTVLVAAFVVNGTGTALSSVAAVSIRQTVTPPEVLGRMTASYRFVSYGAVPLGAAAGGLTGQVAGPHLGLVVGTLGLLTTVGWVVWSPLPRLRTLDDAANVHPGGRRRDGDPAAPTPQEEPSR